jgi:hypothetical protein
VLRDWKSLKEIDLKDTKITEAAVQQLRTALPGCEIRY